MFDIGPWIHGSEKVVKKTHNQDVCFEAVDSCIKKDSEQNT